MGTTDSAGDTVVGSAVASSTGVVAERCADVGLARRPFFGVFGVFFARAPFCAPASAETSSVQQTRRPGRRGGMLFACFDTANR